MATYKQKVEYQIGVSANTQQAEKNLKALSKQLNSIANFSNTKFQNMFGSGFTQSAKSAEERVIKIKENLQQLSSALNSSLDINGNLQMSKFMAGLDGNVTQITKDLSAMGPVGKQALLTLSNEALKLQTVVKETHPILKKMGETLANTIRWQISTKVLTSFTGSIQQAYGYTKNLDSSLNDIRIVTQKSADEMDHFAKSANTAAQQLGSATTEYTNASLIYYQQGLGDREVAQRTETTIKAANVTGQSAQEVSEGLTALWNGFQVDIANTESYVDKLAAVAANSASDLEELTTAMSKVAATATTTGVDVDQLTAQIATIVSVTRQAPESVGTALKTIYARMGDLVIDGQDEDGVALGTVSSQLEELGIHILDTNGDLRDMGEVVEEVGEKWQSWTSAQQQAVAIAIAGKRQYTMLNALFSNWEMYNEQLNTAVNAEGTLQEQQDIYLDSMEARLQKLETAKEALYGEILDSDSLNNIVDLLTDLVEEIEKAVKAVGGGIPLLKTVGSLAFALVQPTITKGIQTFVNNIALTFQKSKDSSAAVTFLGQAANALSEQMAASNAEIASGASFILQYYQRANQLKNLLNKGLISEDFYNKGIEELEMFNVVFDEILKREEAFIERFDELNHKINLDEYLQNSSNLTPEQQEEQDIKGLSITKIQEEIKQELDAGTKSIDEAIDKLKNRENTYIQEIVTNYKSAAKNASEAFSETLKALPSFRNQITADDLTSEWATQQKQNLNQLVTAYQDTGRQLDSTQKTVVRQYQSFLTKIEKGTKNAPGADAINTWTQKIANAFNINIKNSKFEKDIKAIVKDLDGDEQVLKLIAQAFGADMGKLEQSLSNLDQIMNTFAAARSNRISNVINGVTKSFSQLGLTLNSVLNIINTAKNTEEWSAGTIASIATSIGMIVPSAASIGKSLVTSVKMLSEFNKLQLQSTNYHKLSRALSKAQTDEEKRQLILAALQKDTDIEDLSAQEAKTIETQIQNRELLYQKALTLSITAAIAAAVIGVIALVKETKANKEALEEQAQATETNLKVAKKVAEQAKQDLEDRTRAVTDLASAWEELNSKQDALKDLKVGTEEWNKALQDSNQQIYDLISQFPELAAGLKRTTGNILSIDEDTYKDVMSQYQSEVAQAQQRQLLASANEMSAEAELNIKNTYSKALTDANKDDILSKDEIQSLSQAAVESTEGLKKFEDKFTQIGGSLGELNALIATTQNSNSVLNDSIKNIQEEIIRNSNNLSEMSESEKTLAANIIATTDPDSIKTFDNRITSKSSGFTDVNGKWQTLGDVYGSPLTRVGKYQNAIFEENFKKIIEDYLGGEIISFDFNKEKPEFEIKIGDQIYNQDDVGQSWTSITGWASSQAEMRQEVEVDTSSGEAVVEALEEQNFGEELTNAIADFLTGAFTDEQVLLLKDALDEGKITQEQLEEIFSVTGADFSSLIVDSGAAFSNYVQNTANKIDSQLSLTAREWGKGGVNEEGNIIGSSKDRETIQTLVSSALEGKIDSSVYEDFKESLEEISKMYPEILRYQEIYNNEALQGTKLWLENLKQIRAFINEKSLQEKINSRNELANNLNITYVDESTVPKNLDTDIKYRSLTPVNSFLSEVWQNRDNTDFQISYYNEEDKKTIENWYNAQAKTNLSLDEISSEMISRWQKASDGVKFLYDTPQDMATKVLGLETPEIELENIGKREAYFDNEEYIEFLKDKGITTVAEEYEKIPTEVRQKWEDEFKNPIEVSVAIDELSEEEIYEHIDEVEQTLEALAKEDYEIDVQIKTNAEEEFNNAEAALQNLTKSAELIGEDYIVKAEDITELAQAYPGILENVQDLGDGTVQLNKEIADSAIEAAKTEAQAEVDATIVKLQAAQEVLNSKAELYRFMQETALAAAEGEISADDAVQDITAANDEIQAMNDEALQDAKQTNSLNTTEQEIANAEQTAKAWQDAYSYMIDAALKYGEASYKASQASQGKYSELWTDLENQKSTFAIEDFTTDAEANDAETVVADMEDATTEEKRERFYQLAALYAQLAEAAESERDSIKAQIVELGSLGSGVSTKLSEVGKQAEEEEEEEIDRLKSINDQIETQERLLKKLEDAKSKAYGTAFVDILSQENGVLEKSNELLEKKAKIIGDELSQQQADLSKYGFSFDEYGNVTNYYETLIKLKKQDADSYEKAKAEIDDYSNSLNNWYEVNDKISENRNKQVQNQIEASKKLLEIEKNRRDIQKSDSDFRISMSDEGDYLGRAREQGSQMNIAQQGAQAGAKNVKFIEDQIDQYMKSGYMSVYGTDINAAMEDLKTAQKDTQDNILAMKKAYDAAMDEYLGLIDETNDALGEQASILEDTLTVIEHYAKMHEMYFGDTDSAVTARIDQARLDTQNRITQQRKAEADYWREQMDATADKSSEVYKKFEENYNEALQSMNSSMEQAMDAAATKYENTITRITLETQRALSGTTFNQLDREWELDKKIDESRYDAANRVFELEKLRYEYTKAADEASEEGQAKINALMAEQLGYLEQKENLTKYDVERSQKLLDLEKARIALEDAQNNKNSMRLKRDAAGNYSYQYVADQSAVDEAQNAYNTAQQALYNFDKESYQSNLDTQLSLTKEFNEQIKAIYEDTTLSQEEKEQEVAETREKYRTLLLQNSQQTELIRRNLTSDTTQVIKDHDNIRYTSAEKALNDTVAGFTNAKDSAIEQVALTSDKINTYIDDTSIKIGDAFQTFNDDMENAAAVGGQSFNTIKEGIDGALTSADSLLKTNEDYVQSLKDGMKEMATYITDLGKIKDSYDAINESVIKVIESVGKYLGLNPEAAVEDEKLPPKGETGKTGNGETDKTGNGETGNENEDKTIKENGSNNRKPIIKLSSDNKLRAWFPIPNGKDVYRSGDRFEIMKFIAEMLGINSQAIIDARNLRAGYYSSLAGHRYDSSVEVPERTAIVTKYKNMINAFLTGIGSQITISEDAKKHLLQFRSGGYTGAWGSEGRLGVLHEKELVLNKDDTANMLEMTKVARQYASLLNGLTQNKIASISSVNSDITSAMYGLGGAVGETYINIDASFPNANKANEIEEAFKNLTNYASQQAHLQIYKNGTNNITKTFV